MKQDYKAVDLSNQKIVNKDFSVQDLTYKKVYGTQFISCNFDSADMTEAEFINCSFPGTTFRKTNMYRLNARDSKFAGSVFEPSDAYGLCWSMQCGTFDGMELSNLWFFAWLLFATMMKPNDPQDEKLVDQVIAVIGSDKYVRLKSHFSRREL